MMNTYEYNEATLQFIYFPYIDYCPEVWDRTYPSNVNSVYIMQEKAIRRILNAHYNEQTNNYFIELNA